MRRFPGFLFLTVAGFLSHAGAGYAETASVYGLEGHSVRFVNAATGQDEVLEGSKKFISNMAQRAISFLSDENLSHEKRKEQFRQLLRAHYDMKTIGRFALGPYWRTATPAQQAEYLRLFENMVVDVYSARFSDYKGQSLEILGARNEGTSDIVVSSSIVPKDGGDDVKVDWRVRRKDGQYKVIDVIVAGVSMAMTQRSDFSSVIQSGGGDVSVLLAHLRGEDATKDGKAQP